MAGIQNYANSLAKEIEQSWRSKNFDEGCFPQIAAEGLASNPFAEELDSTSLIRFGLLHDDLAYQSNPGYPFGEPPMVLCRREFFEVGVLFWLNGTTSIHQHSFSGAFQVLEGSSLHSEYTFHLKEIINERMLLGDVCWQNSELLTKRMIRPITAGQKFIHSLFHLDKPTVTLIVRTHTESRFGPQYKYQPSGFAFDPFYKTNESTFYSRLAASLVDLRPDGFEEILRELFEKGHLEKNVKLLLSLNSVLRKGNHATRALIDMAVGKREDLKERLSKLIEENLRTQNLATRRKDITDPNHRFLLGALMSLPNRQSILKCVSEYTESMNPVEMTIRWIRELTECNGSH